METSVKKIKNLPLRKYLVFSVLITLVIIVLLSSATIFGCMTFRKYLLPESNNVFLTVDETYADGTNVSYSMRVKVGEEGAELPVLMSEDGTAAASKQTKYTIQRIENSVDSLTPKRKLAYRFCGAVMIVFPLLFSIVGILLCGFHFYRKKLSVPLNLLSDATKQISDRDLDFHLQYENEDEMGILCGSFEQMRQTLRENYREMWNLLEERRLLQASIAHDLRNPIAVIEGYTEYLQMNLAKGKLNNQRVLKIAENLNLAARRLEHYTESVRTLNQMDNALVLSGTDYGKALTTDDYTKSDDDWNNMYKNSSEVVATLDLNTKTLDEKYRMDNATLHSIAVMDGTLYVSNSETGEIKTINLTTKEEKVLCTLAQNYIMNTFDHVLCCDTWNDENDRTYYFVNTDTGEVQHSSLVNQALGWNLEFKAEVGSQILVIYDYEYTPLGDNSYDITQYKYALIDKSDLYAGNAKYEPILMVGKGC